MIISVNVVNIKKWVDINKYKYVCIKLVHAFGDIQSVDFNIDGHFSRAFVTLT